MGKLAYRTDDDEFKTFVGFAYRKLYGERVLGDLPDEIIDQIEELTRQRIDLLTKYIDYWLENEGRQRVHKTSIAYVPVNDFDVYCEMERADMPPFEEDRYDVMALCVLKAAREGNKSGCMNPGARLAEYVGAVSVFDDKTKEIYRHGKDMQPHEAAQAAAHAKCKKTRKAIADAIRALRNGGNKITNKAIARKSSESESTVSRVRRGLQCRNEKLR